METYEINNGYGTPEKVTIRRSTYMNNGSLAVVLICDDGMPYTTLTVNLDGVDILLKARPNYAFVDTNNNAFAEAFLKNNELAKPVIDARTDEPVCAKSGFCTYPLYEFDLDKIPEVEE